MDFTSKTIVITGGGSGIGEETAYMFSEHGAQVAVWDIDIDNAKRVANKINTEYPQKAIAVEVDVSSLSSAQQAVQVTVQHFNTIDVLFNNAGIAPRASVEDMDEELWRKVMSVDLDSVFYVTKAALPHLKSSQGNIVNTGSQCSIAGYENLAAYTAAKAGVLMLTKQMAVEFKKHKIRVNTVLPGVVATPMQIRVWKSEGKDYESMDKSNFQTPRDIAQAVLFFADSSNAMISGNALAVNGVHHFI